MVDLPNPNDKIKELGADFALALDTDRKWATGVQTFVFGDFTVIAFREQTVLQMPDGNIHQSMKNVTSVVMPTSVAHEFHKLLGDALKLGDDDADK